jgi:oligopeptide/dipeptide ABC transporter ATP-binding protein
MSATTVTSEIALSARGITVGLRRDPDRPLVRDASLDIARGEILGLVGESGSGKSTLCRAVAALLSVDLRRVAGEIVLDGRDLSGLKGRQIHALQPRGISMVFQDPLAALNPVMRVGDQVAEAYRTRHRVSRREALDQAVRLLDRMGVRNASQRVHDFPFELSGGQRQRVVLAMALATDPLVLLADEPTSAVDVVTQGQILDLLCEIAVERQVGVLVVTHDFAVVSKVCAKVAVMYAGSIVEHGPTRSVLERPRHPYTRGLIDSLPSIARRVPRLPVIPANLRAAAPDGSCPFYQRCEVAQEGPCTTGYDALLRELAPEHRTACVLEGGEPAGAETEGSAATGRSQV